MLLSCPKCGKPFDGKSTCPRCGTSMVARPSDEPISIESRKTILQSSIAGFLKRGYRVVAQTDTTAQLVKPKSFSLAWGCLFTILLLPIVFYLLWYLLESEKQIYLSVDEFGQVGVAASRGGGTRWL